MAFAASRRHLRERDVVKAALGRALLPFAHIVEANVGLAAVDVVPGAVRYLTPLDIERLRAGLVRNPHRQLHGLGSFSSVVFARGIGACAFGAVFPVRCMQMHIQQCCVLMPGKVIDASR